MSLAVPAASRPVALATIGPLERHQSCLVRMDRQIILGKALGEDRQDPAGIFFVGESHDEVVRVADQERSSFQPSLNIPLEPIVQHVVQENVREHRADHAPKNVAKNRVGGHPQKGMD